MNITNTPLRGLRARGGVRSLGDLSDLVMIEIARTLGWPTDEKAMAFYRLAEHLPAAELKTRIVDAGMSGELGLEQATGIIRALGLENA